MIVIFELKFKVIIYSVLNWGQQNQVKFNPDKSQLIFFSDRNNTVTEIVFQNMSISSSSSSSLLGIDINCRLSWTDHVRTMSQGFKKDWSAL